MKTKDVMIILLSGALIVMIVLYFQKESKPELDPEVYIEVSEGLYVKGGEESALETGYGLFKDDRFESDTLENICKYTPNPSDGEATTNLTTVGNVIDTYETNRGGHVEIMAYHIGLDHLNIMYAQAKAYNDTAKIDSDRIAGYRFYHCTTSRDFELNTDQEWSVTNKMDIVAVPTLKSGDDYYKVYNSVGKHNTAHVLKMFYHFRPCPKVCGK